MSSLGRITASRVLVALATILTVLAVGPGRAVAQTPMHERRVQITPAYRPYHQRPTVLPSVRHATNDDLFTRVVGAYRVLDELFAPYEAPVPMPYDSKPAVYRMPHSDP
jgi:hypothetical protein